MFGDVIGIRTEMENGLELTVSQQYKGLLCHGSRLDTRGEHGATGVEQTFHILQARYSIKGFFIQVWPKATLINIIDFLLDSWV